MTHRGTVHANQRGNAADRRARRDWLVREYGNDGITLCWRCDVPTLPDEITIDRYPVPGCDGGRYVRGNIRPACALCNSEAGGRTRSTVPGPTRTERTMPDDEARPGARYDVDAAIATTFRNVASATDTASTKALEYSRHIADGFREQFAGRDLRLVGEALVMACASLMPIADQTKCPSTRLAANMLAVAGALIADGADAGADR
jgi:hypothetical protein